MNSKTSSKLKQSISLTLLFAICLISQGCIQLFVKVLDGPPVYNETDEMKRQDRQKKVGDKIMAKVIMSLPNSLSGWERTDYSTQYSSISGSQYAEFKPIKLTTGFRRPDGSNNIYMSVIVNPEINQLTWSPESAYLSNNAKSVSLSKNILGWGNQDYGLNQFIPVYDQHDAHHRAYMVQIFLGAWTLNTDPQGYLIPGLDCLSSKRMIPHSPPSKYDSDIYPRCIAITVVSKDEIEAWRAIQAIDIKGLQKIIRAS